MKSCSLFQPKLKAASATVHGYFKPQNSMPPNRKGYRLLTLMTCIANDCNNQEEVFCVAAVINIHEWKILKLEQ